MNLVTLSYGILSLLYEWRMCFKVLQDHRFDRNLFFLNKVYTIRFSQEFLQRILRIVSSNLVHILYLYSLKGFVYIAWSYFVLYISG